MNKEKETMQITEENIEFIEKEFSRTNKPLSLKEVTKKLAYKKRSGQMSQEVKMYDPECQYEVGNLIYKEYDEPLMVSSKGMEPFKGAVVLRVVGKIDYKDFNCEMLEVDYSGGGLFRKYIDYMKKTKTQVLLPSNLEGKAKVPKEIDKKEDPRLTALPMTDRDLKTLEKNLGKALSKSPKFFNWNDYWQLSEKQIEIKEKKINEIKALIEETKLSAATTELVEKLFNIKSTDELFDLHCMSLTYVLEKKFKKDFTFVSPLNWGKWHLKKTLQSFSQSLPLSAPKAKVPASLEEAKEEISHPSETPIKIYLGWREILSGGIKIPKSLTKEFSQAREYIFTDTEGEKNYTVYYYPSSSFILGLKEFYEAHNVPQGASLTLERKGLNQFDFWLKKSKKKVSVLKITYDPKKDVLEQNGEEVFTFSIPNKIIHLERETLERLLSLYKDRKKLELPELLAFVFKNFGWVGNKCSLHYLRAYHLVDVLKRTTQEDVEKALLTTPEFIQSEKNAGIFFYQEKIEEEEKPEKPLEVPEEERIEEAPAARPPLEAPGEEIPPPQVEAERREEVRAEAPPAPVEMEIEGEERVEKPSLPKKEKISRKKRMRMEAEREQRSRRGAKRIIEEKIEVEESEQEALLAVKEKEKREVEVEKPAAPPKEKKKKAKPAVSEEPVFGLFAEKLKTALDKKGKEKKEKK
ncbi:MAG: hypothetical protein PVI11_07990 [Candidatus Aminicenantes bacterium]|jgi:hypothetical protein